MKNILLTGGLGYIGSILTEYLLNEKYKVTIIDNNIYKQNSLARFYINYDLEVVKGDVRDVKLMSQLLKKNVIIIPLKCTVAHHYVIKIQLSQLQLIKTGKWLFEKCSKNQLIIMPTTNSAYGIGDENHFCDEDSN